MQIPIFQITVNDGRRAADQEAVHKLADSISKVGLINPITVDQGYTLIAGLHRLEAAKMLGWTEIECSVSGLEGLQAELAEIDENFVRKDLSDDDFRELLLRRKEIYENLHPETKATYNGGSFKGNQHDDEVSRKMRFTSKSFAQDTAEKLGVSKSTVEREIQTAKNLTSEAKEIIKGAKVTKANALKLSRLPPEKQESAARLLVTGVTHSLDEYRPAQTGPEPAPTPPSAELTPPEPPATAPASECGYYPTIRDSVADLKDPDKDRSRTPEMFLASFTFFLQRFCQGIGDYISDENAAVLPVLTQQQLDQIRQDVNSTCLTLRNLLHKIERMAQK